MLSNKLLDDIGRQILRILQEDGRISFNELGRKVGLSSPAVAERVRRMEEAGIILGYRAIVDQSRVGYPIMAFVRLSIPVSFLAQADELAKSIPEVPNATTSREATALSSRSSSPRSATSRKSSVKWEAAA